MPGLPAGPWRRMGSMWSRAPSWHRYVSEPSLDQLSHKHTSQSNKCFCFKALDLVTVGYAAIANWYGAISFKGSCSAEMVEHYSPICFPLFFAAFSCIFYLCGWAESFLRNRMLTFFSTNGCRNKAPQTRIPPPPLRQSLWLGSLHIHSQSPSPLLFSTTKAGSQILSFPVSLMAWGSHVTQLWPLSPEENSAAEVF